jgi:hypothetical protein
MEAINPAVAELPRLEKLDLRWNNLIDPPAWLERLRARGCVVLD